MSDTTETQKDSNTPYLDMQAKLLAGQQAMAMDHLNLDRCLLRRDMTASQNMTYGFPKDKDIQTCEDDMGVQVGDNDNKVVHNHYHNEQPSQPVPCPPTRRIPWWLVVLLVVPWIILAIALVGWAVSRQPAEPTPIVWELAIDSENPEPIAQPQE